MCVCVSSQTAIGKFRIDGVNVGFEKAILII